MVGRPSGYGGFPYQRNTFCSMAVVTNAALPNVGSRGPLGHPPLPGVVRPAPAPEGVREVRSLAQLRCSPTSRPPPPQAWSSGRGPRSRSRRRRWRGTRIVWFWRMREVGQSRAEVLDLPSL